jgi:hypothetical protein
LPGTTAATRSSVDWIVVQFPGSRVNGEIAAAVADLVKRGIIRVLDLLILKKDTDGSLDAFELADLNDEIGDLNDRCGGDVGAPCSRGRARRGSGTGLRRR